MKTAEKKASPSTVPLIQEPSAGGHPVGWTTRLGLALKSHGRMVAFIQWCIVFVYLLLLVIPAVTGNVLHQRFSRLVLWGIGWPCIVLSILLLGRFWCGLFCPDGTLTETVSHRGRNGSIPVWMRWKWLPCAVLVLTVLIGQSAGVQHDFQITLLFLGIPTCLAMACGFLYGRGRRIWCMYLCPANGFFSLLARLSMLYFAVDKIAWKSWRGRTERINCAPLVNIQQMTGMSACHACGRCVGYRQAVQVDSRKPWDEIVGLTDSTVSNADAVMLLWGVAGIGVCSLAPQTSLIVQYANRMLDGIGIAGMPFFWSKLLMASVSGSMVALVLYALQCFFAHLQKVVSWKLLSFGLLPVAGWGVFLGVCRMGVAVWQEYGFDLFWFAYVEKAVMLVAVILSLKIGSWLMRRFRQVHPVAGIGYTATVLVLAVIQLSLPVFRF